MVTLSDVQTALHRLYIGAAGASLRQEDRKKAAELVGLLNEIEHILQMPIHGKSGRKIHLVDAAAGKAYVGLLAAEFFLARSPRRSHVTMIEREAGRAAACREAVARVGAEQVEFTVVQSEVADKAAWPDEPDVVVALHACGPAADTIAERAVACRARHLLLVPCCTSEGVPAARLATQHAEALGLPRHAEVRRRFIQSIVDAERTLRLEAAGYETHVVSFVPPTHTPHNLLWRARRVGEPVRMAEAARKLQRLHTL
jgi:Methyltransferase domain